MTYRTADEAQAEYIDKLGTEFGGLLDQLINECSWLDAKWSLFLELFGTNPSNIDLFNETAPFLFRVIQDEIWRSTLLDITALTDRPEMHSRNNLSITRIPLYIEDAQFKTEIEDDIATAHTTAEFARIWRNRKIAHRDLLYASSPPPDELPTATRDETQAAIDSIFNVLSKVHIKYFNSGLNFGGKFVVHNARHLVHLIQRGLETED